MEKILTGRLVAARLRHAIFYGFFRIMPRIMVELSNEVLEKLPFDPDTDGVAFEPYTAREMTGSAVALFDRVVEWRR